MLAFAAAAAVGYLSYSSNVEQLELLKMDPTFLNRNVNQGFSGGEKKRNEILQLAVLDVRTCNEHKQHAALSAVWTAHSCTSWAGMHAGMCTCCADRGSLTCYGQQAEEVLQLAVLDVRRH
jgi:hypothetical protein